VFLDESYGRLDIFHITFSPDGNFLGATAFDWRTREGHCFILNLRSGALFTLHGVSPSYKIYFTPDSKSIIVLSSGGGNQSGTDASSIQIIDTSGTVGKSIPASNLRDISGDGEWILLDDANGITSVVNRLSGVSNPLGVLKGKMSGGALNQDGTLAVLPFEDGNFRILGRDAQVKKIIRKDYVGTTYMLLPREGGLIVTNVGEIVSYDANFKEVSRRRGHSIEIRNLDISRDRKYLLSASTGFGGSVLGSIQDAVWWWDASIKIWDRSGIIKRDIASSVSHINDAAFYPASENICAAATREGVKFWNYKTGASLSLSLRIDGNFVFVDDESRFFAPEKARSFLYFTENLQVIDSTSRWNNLYRADLVSKFLSGESL